MSRHHWIVLAVVVGVALVWWVVTLDLGERAGDPGSEPSAAPTPSEAPVAAVAVPNTAPAPPASPPTERAVAAHTEAVAKPSAEPPTSTVPIPAPERSGPVDELKRAFEREPRASGGTRFEAAIEAQFRRPEVPSGLLKSVICRTSVCRIETRWSPERAEWFMGSLMNLVVDPSGAETLFDGRLGISPEGAVGSDGSRAIDVYLTRAVSSAQQ